MIETVLTNNVQLGLNAVRSTCFLYTLCQ